MSHARISRAEVVRELQELGVHTVSAFYDGSGDEGQIAEVTFGDVEVPLPVMRAVESLFYDVLENLYAGWEINSGSFGDFSWDIDADKISLVHNARSEDVYTEEQEL